MFWQSWHKNRQNVGEYTSPMDGMGYGLPQCFGSLGSLGGLTFRLTFPVHLVLESRPPCVFRSL